MPRFRVLYNPNNAAGQTERVAAAAARVRRRPGDGERAQHAATDPLAGYDLLFNSAVGYPPAANAVARNRAAGVLRRRRRLHQRPGGRRELRARRGLATGLATASNSGGGSGHSGIVLWDNTGGANSVITGAYPATDTAIVDPPTWLTAVPANLSVDARFATGDFFLSGLFPGWETSGAAGSAIIAHGTDDQHGGLTVFANNPLYRADPEREWPMVATAAYWGDN